MNKLCHKILNEITSVSKLWKSANPVNPANVRKLIRRKLDPMVDDQPVHDLLAFVGIKVSTTEYLVENLPRDHANARGIVAVLEGSAQTNVRNEVAVSATEVAPAQEEKEDRTAQAAAEHPPTTPPSEPAEGPTFVSPAAVAQTEMQQAALPTDSPRGTYGQTTLSMVGGGVQPLYSLEKLFTPTALARHGADSLLRDLRRRFERDFEKLWSDYERNVGNRIPGTRPPPRPPDEFRCTVISRQGARVELVISRPPSTDDSG